MQRTMLQVHQSSKTQCGVQRTRQRAQVLVKTFHNAAYQLLNLIAAVVCVSSVVMIVYGQLFGMVDAETEAGASLPIGDRIRACARAARIGLDCSRG